MKCSTPKVCSGLILKLYDNTEYKVRLAEQTGFLFNAPKRAVKVVAIEHQRGGRGREVFYSTEVDARRHDDSFVVLVAVAH